MNIKSKISMAALVAVLTVAASALLLGCSSGCTTTGGNTNTASTPITLNTNTGLVAINGVTINTNAEYQAIKAAASAGALAAISKDTNAIPYLKGVKEVINAALNNGNYDVTNLQSALSTVSINELKNSAQTQAYVQEGLSFYGMFAGSLVTAKIDNASPYLAPALAALRDGIAVVVP